MKLLLKWIVYGPNYEMNQSLLREAIRRREASQAQGVSVSPKLQSLERGMNVLNFLILWTWRFVTASAVVAIVLISLGMIPGCAAPQEPHTSLVLHVGGTIYDPEFSRDFSRGQVLYDPTAPEFSRNDKYMGIRTQHERYLRHLSLTIKTTDRQSTINGRIVDRHTTETKTTEWK